MFFFPFLKYLRPHRLRLALAMVCLLAGGFFSTYNILLAKPAMDVLFKQIDPEVLAEQFRERRKEDAEDLERYRESTEWEHRAKHLRNRVMVPIRHKITELRIEIYRYAARDKKKTKTLRALAGIVITMALINALLVYGLKYNMAYALFRAVIDMKSDLFRHVLGQDMRFFTTRSVGFLMSRVTSDVGALRNIFEILIRGAVQQFIRLLFLLTIILFISPRLTGFVFLAILPAVAILAYFAKQIKRITIKKKHKADVLASVMNESLANIRMVKAQCAESLEADRFDKHNRQIFQYDMRRRVAKFGSAPIMEVLGAFGVGAVLIAGGHMVFHQGMEPSTFIVYIIALTQFYKPIKKLAKVNVNWQVSKVSAQRILEILALQPAIVDPPEGEAVQLERITQGLELRQVTFAYDDKTILDRVDARFPRGETTAIVGRTGSGKTTLANLLLRLYDPDEGEITLDGQNLRRFRVPDLRRHFALVSQEVQLFNATVAQNIAYATPDPDPEKIEQAARAANAHEFITQLDGGKSYKTPLGPGGGRLSGGQRQRITIARAFFRDPQILILDEATSSLDNESEAAIQDSLAKLMEHRTVVVIAHRLTTIQHADNIIVLHEGQVVEQGTHQELLDQKGHYHTLYRHGEFTA